MPGNKKQKAEQVLAEIGDSLRKAGIRAISANGRQVCPLGTAR
jgi:hypothetical protein